MKSCDIHPAQPASDTDDIEGDDYAGLKQEETNLRGSALLQAGKPGSFLEEARQRTGRINVGHYIRKLHAAAEPPTVYVITTALPAFLEEVFPLVNRSFVLVSGDSDEPPAKVLGEDKFQQLASSPLVLRWFAQNSLTDHPKVERMPIGLDYHSIAAGKPEWGPQASATEQEQELMAVRDQAPANKTKKVFLGYMIPREGRRMQIQHLLDRNDNTYMARLSSPTERHAFWTSLAQYEFVASPIGHGADCHRTYETLALGSVPVVDKSPLNRVFTDNRLPVLEADDSTWGHLDTLIAKANSLKLPEKGTILPAMKRKYWVAKFRAAASQDVPADSAAL